MPTSLAQKEANKRWRMKNKQYWVTYNNNPETRRGEEFYRNYYAKNKNILKYRAECRRMRNILL